MFALPSQSGSSFVTYLLTVCIVFGSRFWTELWRDRVFLLAVGISLYIASTSFWSAPFDARGAGSQFIRALLQVCFVVAVVESFRVDWFRVRLTLTIAIGGGAAALVALVIFFLDGVEGSRLNGLGQLDTHVRAALVFSVSLVFALAWFVDVRSPRWRLAAVAVVVCLSLAVALSGSRTAWVVAPFGCAIYLISRSTTSRAQFVALGAFVAAIGVIVLVAAWYVPEVRGFLLPRGDSYRLAIWGETIQRIVDHGLWFGNGVLSDDDVVIDGFVNQHPHNLYLAILFQGGVLGLLIFAMLVCCSLAALLKRFEDEVARLGLAIFAIALPAYLLDGFELVDKIGWTWILIWLPVAMSIRVRTPATTTGFSG
jgi:O-antigen ligase